MKYLTIIIIAFCLASCVPFLQAQIPLPETGDNLISGPDRNEGKYYALIIGISNYSDPRINGLGKHINDSEQLYNTLTIRYTFDSTNVKLLHNATKAEIVDALDFFSGIIRPTDNFLIFYAGYGGYEIASGTAFWFPSDADKNNNLTWFSNSTLLDYLRKIKSKHTLLIIEASFAGSIFKGRSAFKGGLVDINKLYELPSRKAMTSVGLTELPDQSTFPKYLVAGLINNDKRYFSSEQLFSSFRNSVINSSNIIPQYGVIQGIGDEGGDFIFILK
jgi:hypothetical protein